MILCYKCGTAIQPNGFNMCMRCMNNSVDLAAKVKKYLTVEKCRGCGRYHLPPSLWKSFAWGSKDLLIFLLSRNKTLKKLNVIDSNFLYTEEHSNKVKIEIILLENAIEQPITLDFTLRNKQCPLCTRIEAKQFWRAIVQLRQKPHHRRTFMYLERLMMQHKAHAMTSNIVDRKDGIDFLFQDTASAQKMVDFLRGFFGVSVTTSEQLISHDTKSNTANKKMTFSVKILPFCVDDLVLSDDKSTGLGSILLVKKVKNSVEFFDPITQKTAKITSKHYFANEGAYKILLRSVSLKKYSVICARRSKDGLYDTSITEDSFSVFDVTIPFSVIDGEDVYGYDIETLNLSTDINLGGIPVLVVRKDVPNYDELVGEDREMKYLLADVSTEKSIIQSIIGSLPSNSLIDQMSKVNLSESEVNL